MFASKRHLCLQLDTKLEVFLLGLELTSSQIEGKTFNLELCHGLEILFEFHVKVML